MRLISGNRIIFNQFRRKHAFQKLSANNRWLKGGVPFTLMGYSCNIWIQSARNLAICFYILACKDYIHHNYHYTTMILIKHNYSSCVCHSPVVFASGHSKAQRNRIITLISPNLIALYPQMWTFLASKHSNFIVYCFQIRRNENIEI